LHLRSFVRRKAELEKAGVEEVIFFHSTPEALLQYCDAMPFQVVGDPQKVWYKAFGVEASARAVTDPRAWPTIARAVAATTRRLLFEGAKAPPRNPLGGRLGLPADLLIDPSGKVHASHYGAHVDDQWSVDEVLALAAEALVQELGRPGMHLTASSSRGRAL
jgi:hypothetical protein